MLSYKRILLVKPAGKKVLSFSFDLIPIGLEYIAAYLYDAVDQIHIVDMEPDKRRFQDIINLYSPDLIGITLSATEHKQSLSLAGIAKKNNISTVVGGYHPTSVPNLMLSYPQIDIVVHGRR